MSRCLKIIISFIIPFLISINFVYAQTKESSLKKNLFCEDRIEQYQQASMHKLERGLLNTFSFWTEIPEEIGSVSTKKGILQGVSIGSVQGLIKSTARLLLAVVDIATFPFYPEKKPFLEPEYADGKLDEKIREYLW